MTRASNDDTPPVTGLHHIAVQTHDLQASLRLYHELLGMPIVNLWGGGERKMALLDTGNGAHIELVAPAGLTAPDPAPPAAPPLLHLALATPNLSASVELVRAGGYQVTVEPKDVQLGIVPAAVAFFLGPNGERVEFFQTR